MRDISLTDALRRLVAGGAINDELLSRVSWEQFGTLEQTATKAWQELQQWVSDEDIRTRDKAYEQDRRARLVVLLEEIEAGRRG